jgi:hypothetical protein
MITDAIRRQHSKPPQPGQRIMKMRLASKDRSWMWQPPLPGDGANQFAGRELHPLKSSAFAAHCYVNYPAIPFSKDFAQR